MRNQDIEDELQRELERLYKCVVYDLIDDVDRKELWIKEVGVVVQTIIRTEKLKLLDEVRERSQSMPIHGYTDSYSPSKYVQAVSVDALKELEAEL